MEARGESGEPIRFEKHRRYALPIASLLCAVLGLAIGASTAGGGRLGSFALAGSIVLAQYMVMFGARAQVMRGRMPGWTASWLPVALLAVVAIGLVAWRVRGGKAVLDATKAAGVLRRLAAAVICLQESFSRRAACFWPRRIC
jgi:lipopolysaccharide export system permease protein